MRKVSIKAVLIGGVLDVVSSFSVIPFAIAGTLHRHHSSIPRTAIHGGDATGILLHSFEILFGMCCSVFGGYMAARIAKHHELLNGALSSWSCILLSTLLMAFRVGSNPTYVKVLFIALSPLLALTGGFLRSRQLRAR